MSNSYYVLACGFKLKQEEAIMAKNVIKRAFYFLDDDPREEPYVRELESSHTSLKM